MPITPKQVMVLRVGLAFAAVALPGAWRYRRWLFRIFLPFFLCMMVATVYGRYHYIADMLGGLVVGAIGFVAGHRLMRCEGAVPPVEARREA